MSRIHRPRSAPERVDRFRGKFAFLSNCHRHPFDCRGHTVPTAEHAFQGAKTRDHIRWRARAAMDEQHADWLREDGALPAATAALHNLAARHPRLFADAVRYLFGLDRDIARAVTESVRLGYTLDQPLDAALNALTADSNATETAP